MFTCARGRGRGPSWAGRARGASGRGRGRPGAPRPVPVVGPAGPGAHQAQPSPSDPLASSRPPGSPPCLLDAHLTAIGFGTCSAALSPAASRTQLPAAPGVSSLGGSSQGAGRPGALPLQVRPAPPTAGGKFSTAARAQWEWQHLRGGARSVQGTLNLRMIPAAWKREPWQTRNLKNRNLGNFGCQDHGLCCASCRAFA